MHDVTPLLDRVLVEPFDPVTIRPSGLIIPDTARERSLRGRVLAVGPGAPDRDGNVAPMGLQVGDVVLFTLYGGTELEYEGQSLVVFNIRDVLAIIRPKSDG